MSTTKVNTKVGSTKAKSTKATRNSKSSTNGVKPREKRVSHPEPQSQQQAEKTRNETVVSAEESKQPADNIQTEMAQEQPVPSTEAAVVEISEATPVKDKPDESNSSTSQTNELTSSNTGSMSEKQKQSLAHKAAVAANKERARQDRETRRKAHQEAKEAKQTAKAALGERYHNAAAEVGRIRREFLAALDDKARLLGVERVGEAVPMRNDETQALDADIRAARQTLEALLERKRSLKQSTPELAGVTARINRLRKERDEWRREKQAAYLEATANQPQSTESS